MDKARIVSIDGGGVGGVIPAVLLWRLEKARPGFLAAANLFAGTSTGGLLALALASGKPVAYLADFYRKDAPDIFRRSWWKVFSSGWGLVGTRFDNAALKAVLEREFQLRPTLGVLDKPVFIVSGSLVQDGPREFCTWPEPHAAADAKVLCEDAGGATSAASSVFPPWDVAGEGLHVDGGETGMNCPAIGVAAHAMLHPASRDAEIVMLSLGCGVRTSAQNGYGWLGAMAGRIIGWMLEWSVKSTVQACRLVMGDDFHRLDPKLDKDYDSFDPAEVPGLEKAATEWPIDDALAFIDAKWDLPK